MHNEWVARHYHDMGQPIALEHFYENLPSIVHPKEIKPVSALKRSYLINNRAEMYLWAQNIGYFPQLKFVAPTFIIVTKYSDSIRMDILS